MKKEEKKEPKEQLKTVELSLSKSSEVIKSKAYLNAIDFLNTQSSKLNAVTNQLNLLTSPVYQPSILTAVTSVQQQFSTFSKIQTYLPKVDHLFATSPMINLSRQATLAISGLTSPLIMTNLTASIADNYKPWYEANIAKSSVLSVTAFSTLDSKETSKNLATFLGVNSLSELTIQSSIIKATEYSLFAEKSLFAVTQANIGSRLALTIERKEYLTTSVLGLSQSYSTLLKSFETDPLSYSQISPSISRIAPIEYYSTANLLESISVDEDVTAEEELIKNEIRYENEISLSSYLPKIDPGLYKMWKGAIEAYHSNNSDKVRHFVTSIRELYTHLIHSLAPDSQIKKWTTDPQYYHEGRPTRKARLLFICRNINNESFRTFVKKDVEAMIAFIDVFQSGTHNIDPVFSSTQLITIKSKAENTLKFLLEIHFSTNN